MRYFLAAFVLLASQPAYANWQYTKWGMTPERVLKASGGKAAIVKPGADVDADVFNRGPYTSGEYNFTASFHYDSRKLTSVSLEMDGACGALRGDLIGLYGDQYQVIALPGLGHIFMWKDYKKANAISFLDFGQHCILNYSRVDQKTRAGL